MNKQAIIDQIIKKKSFLCVGLDTDITKIPPHLLKEEDPVFAFNKAIIDATQEFAIAYKLNTAFYEAQGINGWISLQKTLAYIPPSLFAIADAKRGDIGNTSHQYAKTFFETYPFHAITVSPYMGIDSVSPFLEYEGKWTIILGLTSNAGSKDFQFQTVGKDYLFEKVITTAAQWGTPENTMFVAGATHNELLMRVRALVPDHFLLIPGIGTQGGDLEAVCKATFNKDIGIMVNVSRAIIYSGNDYTYQEQAFYLAKQYYRQMSAIIG
ncbi:MAG: orotidine-5'-phosphate decarboxylase [Chitinophagia bacterium]|nr:orotidine-5'-phosphate decarboxylase [Chitinophagia bacterium]